MADTNLMPTLPVLGRRSFWRQVCLYPRYYTWFVFLATMDVVFTRLILFFNGRELNGIADWIIRHYGIPGAVALKFGTVILVVTICQIVGLRRETLGRKLAIWAVAISAVPVVVSFVQLLAAVATKRLPQVGEI
jgi:hypothetical protein